MTEPSGAPSSDELPGCWGRGGVGCVTMIAGLFSGGMVAVALSMIWAKLSRAPTCEGIPTCDWHVWMLAGAAVGGITLPAIALWRLRRSK